jgi:adenylate kinase
MKFVKPKLLVFLGPQGSGKGTQSHLLVEKLNVPRAEAGQLCRDASKQDTPLGHAIKAVMDRGELLPIDLWRPVIEQKLKSIDVSEGMIFDGFLRAPNQLAAYEDFRQELHLPEAIVVNLNLTREKSIERLMKRGRVDDTPELIATRLEWSENQVEDVLIHFRTLGKLIDVNADQPIETVQQEIIEKLKISGIII